MRHRGRLVQIEVRILLMLVLLWTKIVNISKFPKRNFLVSNIKLCRSLNGQFHPPAAVGTQRRVAADRSRAASPAATDCIPGDCGGDGDDHLKKNKLFRSFSCGPGDMSTITLVVLAEIIYLLRRGRRPTGQTRPPRSGKVSWRAAATTASPAGSASA